MLIIYCVLTFQRFEQVSVFDHGANSRWTMLLIINPLQYSTNKTMFLELENPQKMRYQQVGIRPLLLPWVEKHTLPPRKEHQAKLGFNYES